MPCNDITEVLKIDLDHADTVRAYTLNKRTCGAPIGVDTLLLPLVGGQSLDAVLKLVLEDTFTYFQPPAEEEFLFAKHLVALQEGLRVLVGQSSAAADGLCTPTTVSAHADGITFEGLVKIDAVTRRIKSCGNCGSCGAHKH